MDKADTAWLAISSILVWLMCVPGLTLFYGGLARVRHVLSTSSQALAASALAVILWFLYGYSLAFTDGSGVLGGWSRLAFTGLAPFSAPYPNSGTIPELLFALFQATFAAITCGLITGSMAERARFGPVLGFIAIWFTLAYLPIAHMVWASDGWLHLRGALDFAGGTVVHISAGIAGLVCARCIGPRRDLGRTSLAPHHLPMNLTGAALLWMGWFGFNGGSALAINSQAVLALVNTLLAPAAGILAWAAVERATKGKASLLGAASGAIAGLVGITPAAGLVAPWASLPIGALTAWAAFYGVNGLKRRLGVDDAFDVFGIHGVGGIVGALLTGIFYNSDLGGPGAGGISAMLWQTWLQVEAIFVSLVWSGVISWFAAKVMSRCLGLRCAAEHETQGLDLAEHGESAYPR